MDESNWSKLNEGWDGGTIDTDEILANLKTVAKNSVGSIGAALAILYAPLILLHAAGAAFIGVAHLVPSLSGVVGIVGILVAILAFFLSLAISLGVYSLYRPLQQQSFEGKEFVPGGIDALKAAKEVLPKVALTTLLFFASCAVGVLACGLGALVAMFFFMQAPWLAATTELSAVECMRRSYELNKRYAMPVALAIAVSFFGVGIIGAVGGGIAGLAGTLVALVFAPLGEAVMMLGIDVITILASFTVLVVFGTLFATIQSIERGVPFRHD